MDLSTVHLWIGTPCYGSLNTCQYTASLLRTWIEAERHHIGNLRPRFIPGDSLITRARNVIVAEFMADPKATHLLFIDADIEWEPDAVFRLLASEHDVCCGVYPKKKLPLEFPLNFCAGADQRINVDAPTGYLEIQDAATGFLMVRRPVLERMMAAYPERKCQLQQEPKAEHLPYQYDLFSCFIDSGPQRMYLSEDFGFSRLWQRIGGRIWLDPMIDLKHHGGHVFQGSIRSFLIPKNQNVPQSAEEIEGWMSPGELAWLRETVARMGNVAELGSWKGRSTYALCGSCKGNVYAVDHWQGSPLEQQNYHAQAVKSSVFPEFLNNVGHFENLRIVKRPTIAAAEEVPEVDMVFVDAAHNYNDVLADLRAWTPKARKLICGHDYNYPGVIQATREMFGDVEQGPGSIWFKELAA